MPPVTTEQLDELAEIDRRGRIGRTATQVGGSSIGTVILKYLLDFLPVDLAPLDPESTQMPAEVLLAVAAAVTVAWAWWMNRQPKPVTSG